MAHSAASGMNNLTIEALEGLLVHYLHKNRASTVIRGLRAISDFEHEFQMALMNRKLWPQIETVFLMPSERYIYLTSTLIKEVAGFGGDISCLVPEIVSKKLHERFSK